MAVVEMSKLNLVAMSYDRDSLLNALQKTAAAEVKMHTETENTAALPEEGGELRAYLASVEAALNILSAETEAYNKTNKIKSDILKDGFDVTYTEFMSAKDMKEEADALVEKINALSDERRKVSAELSGVVRNLASARIYSSVKEPMHTYADSRSACVRLGTVPSASAEELYASLSNQPLAAYTVLNSDGDGELVVIAAHKSVTDEVEAALQSASFVRCPYASEDKSGAEIYLSLVDGKTAAENRLTEISEQLYSISPQIRKLKIYCDYLAFELEKAELSEKMRGTEKTFLLEAFVPKPCEEEVAQAIRSVTDAAYFEFSCPAEDEPVPTLLKNNEVVKNFETITNMYSPVSPREFDPNTVMAVFYSIFLGFIMGDIGYGLIMLLGGGAIYLKNIAKDGGLKRLSGVFAVGGIFAIIWGLLFNSFFGVALPFMGAVMPDAQSDMWTFVGISIPSVLIISLEIGVVQLMTGYICKTWQCWRRGEIADGILDGLIWAVFSLGVGLAVVGLVEEANLSSLAAIGGITAAVCLVIAILTAGRKEKLLGKFTKGFGAAYGIINYASDVLSYARLYGLMLSGAVIAQIISQYAVTGTGDTVGFILSGNPGLIILGVVLLIVGHAFNLAIGLLGAYIHDARLQYVEFYGRFYEGEGELFAPLGSKHKYVSLPAESAAK